jgi:Family of unknown function (DUF6603)
MPDLDAAVLDGSLLFASRRLDAVVQQVGAGPDAFLAALLARPPTPAETTAINPIRNAVQDHLGNVNAHAAALASKLASPPASLSSVADVAGELATALTKLAAAVTAVGAALGGDITAPSGMEALLQRAIHGISETLGGLGGQLHLVGGGQLVSSGLHVAGTTVTLETANADNRVIDPPVPLALHDSTLTARFDWTSPTSLSVKLHTGIRAGLVGDGFVQKILPSAASIDGTVDISDDAASGFTLGSGSKRSLNIPTHLDLAGVTLRSLTLELPDPASLSDGQGTAVALVAAISGSFGPVSAAIDGMGIGLDLDAAAIAAGAANALSIAPVAPTGAGLSINAGVVKVGGYLSVKHGQYGGALDLAVGPIEIKAVGLITPEPFSLVLVLSVEFHPGIQLSFGFTLNGVGGLLAIERTVATDPLRAGLHDHTADALLFPPDPVSAAPHILDVLAADFPRQQGAFVIGPMVEIGWGTPISFVTAKVGVIIGLPDPKIILLGAVRVALPTPEAAIVDLRAELYGEITPQHILIVVSLSGSKIAGFALSGDIGLLIGFGDEAEFALSAGGFHPHYKPPKELAGMQRMSIDLSPPALLTLRAQCYFAVTTNSVQLGALVQLRADIGPAGAEGHLGFDALVRFDPFHFEIDLSAGIALYVFGASFAGVDLSLHLEGPGLWLAQGTASVSFLFFDFDFDVGPLTWGEGENPPADVVSPVQLVADALSKTGAWRSRPLDEANRVVHLLDVDVSEAILVHPLGAFEVQQHAVPLETTIDRVGRHGVSEHRVNLGPPTINGQQAAAVSYATALFPPGQFLELNDDQKLSRPAFEPFPSGMRLAGVAGDTHGTAVESVYRWETVYPHEELELQLHDVAFIVSLLEPVLSVGPAARVMRDVQPYLTHADPVRIADSGSVVIRRIDDLAVAPDLAAGAMTTTDAARMIIGREDVQLVGLGVAS